MPSTTTPPATSSPNIPIGASQDPLVRWGILYDRKMYQLARLEIRPLTDRHGITAAAFFALGITELALRRAAEAARAFDRARMMQQSTTERVASEWSSLALVLERLHAVQDLRAISGPTSAREWLDNPNAVGATPAGAKSWLQMKGMKFVSPLNRDDFKGLESRAGSFSYDTFDISNRSREKGGKNREERHQSRTDLRRAVAPPQHASAPPPIPTSTQHRPAATFGGPMPPPPPPPPTSSRESGSFSVPPPPPAAANDPWAEWEAQLVGLISAGKFGDALTRVREAIGKYPTSARLREHEARLLGESGKTDEAVSAWLETHKRALDAGAEGRAESSLREAMALVWKDAPRLERLVREIGRTKRPGLAGALLKDMARRLLTEGRLGTLDSVGAAMVEVVSHSPGLDQDVAALADDLERLGSSDARAIAATMRKAMARKGKTRS